MPTDANGEPQELRGVGSWSAVSANEISLRDLPDPYKGTFYVQGIIPYGAAAVSPSTLKSTRGISLYGGYAHEATPPAQGNEP